MRTFVVIFLCTLTVGCTWLLDRRFMGRPPLGKFLDPMHGFWANSEHIPIKGSTEIEIDGLRQSVTVYWDKDMIPHIYAQTTYDLYLVQGYVMAFHRLWQMEFMSFKTEGRLSSILGERTVNYDRWQRRKGLRYVAEEMYQKVSEDQQSLEMLEAYAVGVNAYVSSMSYEDYPIEYKLLDYEPESWTPYKSCLLFKEMADVLSMDDKDIENTNLLQALGKDTFDFLFPDTHPGLSYVVPKGTVFDFEPIRVPRGVLDTLQLPLPSREATSGMQHGSNTVVVGPKKSRNGSVLFSNSPDLDLRLPSLWYLNHLIEPTGHVMGGSIPGLPGILVGFNDSIAWGLTNAERDLSDWYQVQFTDPSRQSYHYNDGQYKTKTRIESIDVRDHETIYDTVVYTHHGPVVYDRNFNKNMPKGVNLARHWGGYYPYDEISMIYKVNRAKNHEEFVDAISQIKTPSLNISFASARGDIAIHEQGRYPIKWAGQGKFVMDGRDNMNDWHETIPDSHAIWIKNPEQGFLSAANQHPVDEAYPYYIYSYNFEYFRGKRLNERLHRMNNIEPKDLIQLQYDNFNYIAYESLPLMLDSLDRKQLNVEESKVYEALSRWDYFNDANLVSPAYFEVWFDFLVESIWDEIRSIPDPKYEPSTYHTVYLMRNYAELSFYDQVSSRSARDVTAID